jgi:hypothetical protein
VGDRALLRVFPPVADGDGDAGNEKRREEADQPPLPGAERVVVAGVADQELKASENGFDGMLLLP